MSLSTKTRVFLGLTIILALILSACDYPLPQGNGNNGNSGNQGNSNAGNSANAGPPEEPGNSGNNGNNGNSGNAGNETEEEDEGEQPEPTDTGYIGDYVWHDLNADGLQQGGELGMAGVAVKLYSADETLVADTVTDADGFYAFEDLPAGEYFLQFQAPDGYVFTLMWAGGDAEDSDAEPDGFTMAFELGAGDERTDLDAGLVGTEAGPTCPLTGLPVNNAGELDHKPIGISISQFPPEATRPITGINSAPFVFETWIGEGMTRLFAVFYCDYPSLADAPGNSGNTPAAPRIEGVRSGRTFYAELIKYFGGGLVYQGADPNVEAVISEFKCGSATSSDDDDIGSGGIDLTKLAELAAKCQSGNGNTQLDVYEFGPPPAGGEQAEEFLMFYNVFNRTKWVYDASVGGYVRYMNDIAEPEVFKLQTDGLTGEATVRANVIVMWTEHAVLNSSGTWLDFDIDYQQGKAKLFRDGLAYDICWSTQNGDYATAFNRLRPILFTDCDGNIVPLAAGASWVHVVHTTTNVYYDSGGGYWYGRFYAP